MIKYVTYPRNTARWNHEEDIFFLEVFGETRPRLSPEYLQLLLPEEDRSVGQSTNLAPLYEYYWSLGYIDHGGKHGPSSWGGELADTAAEVCFYFPTWGGWRVLELLATIKYLCPSKQHDSLLQEASHMFATAQPIVEDASKLAAIGSGLPGVGPIAAGTAVLLDTIARLKVTSVPPSNGYEWFVQRVTRHIQGKGLVHGIKWTIPKKMFVEFGARLKGSIAVSVIPSMLQSPSEQSDDIRLEPLPLRATATMHLHPGFLQEGKSVLLPPGDEFLELEIHPRVAGDDEPGISSQSQ